MGGQKNFREGKYTLFALKITKKVIKKRGQ
jgi:hypothetical protein